MRLLKNLRLLFLKKSVRINAWWRAALCIIPLIFAGCGYKRKNFFNRAKKSGVEKLALAFVSKAELNESIISWEPVDHPRLVGYVLYGSHNQRRFVKVATIESGKHSYTLAEDVTYERYALACVFMFNGEKREGPFSPLMIKK